MQSTADIAAMPSKVLGGAAIGYVMAKVLHKKEGTWKFTLSMYAAALHHPWAIQARYILFTQLKHIMTSSR